MKPSSTHAAMMPLGDADLATFLADHPPFDGLADEAVARLASSAVQQSFATGALILDAFRDPSVEVFVILAGRVSLWNDADRLGADPDETLDPGALFGFSAMLTERSVGPRAVAAAPTLLARIPGDVAASAFASRRGARFLAESMFAVSRTCTAAPTYASIDDLVRGQLLVVKPSEPIGRVAQLMTERHLSYAVVQHADGRYAVVTDTSIRAAVAAGTLTSATPAAEVCAAALPTTTLGDSAVEALIGMLEANADQVVVLDRNQQAFAVVSARDFTASATTADVSLHEQLRRAASTADLVERALRIPFLLGDLLSRGLASGKVIAVNSTMIDAVIRRAIELTFEAHPQLSLDAFTWLSLGSNGRREAVLSSDIDSAVAFVGSPSSQEILHYVAAFGEVHGVLAQAGLLSDGHGASASRRVFARTNNEWRTAALGWLAAPIDGQGAMMTSLLVDGRPIFGDRGLPAVAEVFSELRSHPDTMRLLLQDSLARRARLRGSRDLKDLLARRPALMNIKTHAILPIVNLARWAALSVGSPVLPTVERLEVAAGSEMLPSKQAHTLIEVFEVLQRLRLRYQLMEHHSGKPPGDKLIVEHMSPIDRSVISQAVREISAVQKRMANIAAYLPAEDWTAKGQE